MLFRLTNMITIIPKGVLKSVCINFNHSTGETVCDCQFERDRQIYNEQLQLSDLLSLLHIAGKEGTQFA